LALFLFGSFFSQARAEQQAQESEAKAAEEAAG
jgi:hypothetical protein